MRSTFTGILCVLLWMIIDCHNAFRLTSTPPTLRTLTSLSGKKDKKFINKGAPAAPSKGEQQGRADRFDAITRKFMFTIQGLTKSLPDGSRTILKNINLCFYPGAKIGVVGLNGSGKSTLMKIMAGVEKVR